MVYKGRPELGRRDAMRINVEVDEELLLKAIKLTGLKTYRAALEESLRALVQLYQQGEVRDLRGKLHRDPALPQGRRRG
jgi:Arc/MetJ family transcription regulator